MANPSLSMIFAGATGKSVSLTVTASKASVTEAQVTACMDALILNNIFDTSDGELKTKVSAQLVERTVTKILGA